MRIVQNALAITSCVVVAGAVGAFSTPSPSPLGSVERRVGDPWTEIDAVARRVDAIIVATAQDKSLALAPRADDLQIARRLSLSLQGRIPSLEEIRWFEQQPPTSRLRQWTDRLLGDLRHADHLAESLSGSLVNEFESDLPFNYRRPDFVRWLSDRLARHQPYDDTVREMVESQGLWTTNPATNFLTAQGCKPAGATAQTVRSFLGLRMECAECHDHPFADWKRADFHGLAAFYSELQTGYPGIYDAPRDYFMEDRAAQTKIPMKPKVPFDERLDPGRGPLRERLASWLTHDENTYFAKAAVNRFWMIVFGRSPIEPVDDLEKPERVPGALKVLADDFKQSGYDVPRLLRVLVSTEAFCRASALQCAVREEQEEIFAAFPLTKLRPLQIASSHSQTLWLTPLDRSANILLRSMFTWDDWCFWWDSGRPSPDEVLTKQVGLQDQLQLMNGQRFFDRNPVPFVGSAEHLALLGQDDGDCVEVLFLMTLCRRPTTAERDHFVGLLRVQRGYERIEAVQDALWSLANSLEFVWNH